jgi:thymidylate synthase (FAD)
VNYGKKDMEFIEPAGYEGWDPAAKVIFEEALRDDERVYGSLLRRGLKPQQVRAKLPNALKTEIVVTADAKEWAHIRKLRTHKSAHPDIVRVMSMVPWEDIG